MTDCKECDGAGSVQEMTMKSGPNGPIENHEDVECDACRGYEYFNTDDKQEES